MTHVWRSYHSNKFIYLVFGEPNGWGDSFIFLCLRVNHQNVKHHPSSPLYFCVCLCVRFPLWISSFPVMLKFSFEQWNNMFHQQLYWWSWVASLSASCLHAHFNNCSPSATAAQFYSSLDVSSCWPTACIRCGYVYSHPCCVNAECAWAKLSCLLFSAHWAGAHAWPPTARDLEISCCWGFHPPFRLCWTLSVGSEQGRGRRQELTRTDQLWILGSLGFPAAAASKMEIRGFRRALQKHMKNGGRELIIDASSEEVHLY